MSGGGGELGVVGGAVADYPDDFVPGEEYWYRVAVILGDFGVSEEVLELFGAGHSEGGEAVAVSATPYDNRPRQFVYVKESGVGIGCMFAGGGFFDGGSDPPARQ